MMIKMCNGNYQIDEKVKRSLKKISYQDDFLSIIKKKKAAGAALISVELQGVEPWSKQGIPKLSTCLCCY